MKHEIGSPRALARLFGLFGAIIEGPEGLTLAELSVRLQAPKSSLLTMLRPLVAQRYLIHHNARYRFGPATYRVAANILATRRFPSLIRPFMEHLAEQSGETVYLAVLEREVRLVCYVEVIDSLRPVRYLVPVGTTRPLYSSAAGRLLLACESPAWREEYLRSTPLRRLTPRTMVGKTALRKELAQIRRTGIAISMGETVADAGGIAAPIRTADGSVLAALLLGAPVERFERNLPRLRALIQETAALASSVMGTGATGVKLDYDSF